VVSFGFNGNNNGVVSDPESTFEVRFDNGNNNRYPFAQRNRQQQPARNNRGAQRSSLRSQQPQPRNRRNNSEANGYQFSYPQYQNQQPPVRPNQGYYYPQQNVHPVQFEMWNGSQGFGNMSFFEQLGQNLPIMMQNHNSMQFYSGSSRAPRQFVFQNVVPRGAEIYDVDSS
jgi:hypothetical protein